METSFTRGNSTSRSWAFYDHRGNDKVLVGEAKWVDGKLVERWGQTPGVAN